MRRSASDWKRADLDSLYLGFGFEIKPGAKHDVVRHPQYKHLRATLPRHQMLARLYVVQAVKHIDELLELDKSGEETNDGES